MVRSPAFAMLAGAVIAALLALAGARLTAPALSERLAGRAQAAIAEVGARGVTADFTASGWPSRHPLLRGGEGLDERTRARVAHAVAAVPGVAGIRWEDNGGFAVTSDSVPPRPLHCQQDVEALLRARTIRFEESSTRIDAASRELVDEVADALRPCLGSIIAITGHTDSSGPEPGNLELSRDRAEAVLQALVARGIPADGLRVRGVGSSQPVEGLEPTDPANRRIEFSVIATVPVGPTAVDTPGPH